MSAKPRHLSRLRALPRQPEAPAVSSVRSGASLAHAPASPNAVSVGVPSPAHSHPDGKHLHSSPKTRKSARQELSLSLQQAPPAAHHAPAAHHVPAAHRLREKSGLDVTSTPHQIERFKERQSTFFTAPTKEQADWFLANTIAFEATPQPQATRQQSKKEFSGRRNSVSPSDNPHERCRSADSGPDRPPICGRFPWTANADMAHYVTVQRSGKSDQESGVATQVEGEKERFNAHLLRFYANRVWKLPEPDVIISITGGARFFDLSPEHLDKIMKGLLDGTRSLTPWFVTGGTCDGIMGMMGRARAKYNPNAPLIGFQALGGFKGGDIATNIINSAERDEKSGKWIFTHRALSSGLKWEDAGASQPTEGVIRSNEKLAKALESKKEFTPKEWNDFGISDLCADDYIKSGASYFKPAAVNLGQQQWVWSDEGVWRDRENPMHLLSYEELVAAHDFFHQDSRAAQLPRLDENHSHFVFVQDQGLSGMGSESDIRAAFEKCMARRDETSTQIHADLEAKFANKTWDRLPGGDTRTVSKEKSTADEDAGTSRPLPPTNSQDVPLVSVCVQGGCGSIHTVYTTVKSGFPALLVSGSGGAANLISDAVRLMYPPGHKMHVQQFSPSQQALVEFLRALYSGVHASLSSFGPLPWQTRARAEDKKKKWGRKAKDQLLLKEETGDYTYNVKRFDILLETEHQNPAPSETVTLKMEASSLLMNAYGIRARTPYTDLSVLYMALSAANTGLCSVFDLLSTDPSHGDFNGALLWCLLNSIKIKHTQPALRANSNLSEVVAHATEHEAWMRRFKFTLLWDRDDLVSDLLEDFLASDSSKRPEHRDAFLKEGLVYALQCDKVKAVSALLQKGAGVEEFNVGKHLCFVADAAKAIEEVKTKSLSPEAAAIFRGNLHVNTLSKKQYMKATAEWQKLIEHATTPGPGFVTHFSLLRRTVRHDYKFNGKTWWGRETLFKQAEKLIEQLDVQLGKIFEQHKHCIQPGRPLPKKMRPLLYRRMSQVKKRDSKRDKAKPQDEQSDLEHAKNVKELIILEGVFVHLLGDDFRYRMGIQGPHTDLFFWNILLNRCDLAEVFWNETVHPVRTAIAAAYLLRKMAELHFLDHRAAEQLLKNAQRFEDRATEVQQAAERLHTTRESNEFVTLRGLNCELELWRGYSLLDLAVESGSKDFVEKTCRQAIESRLYGDLNPYTNGTYWGTLKILVAMIPIFWFLPAFDVFQWVEFTPPPTHQAWRRRTQRRLIPEGYPYQPSKNPELSRRIQDLLSRSKPQTKHEKLLLEVVITEHQGDESRSVKRLSAEQLEKLWAPTFTVLDRLECFLSAPIVLFCLNAFFMIFTTVLFTVWFLNTRLHIFFMQTEDFLPYVETYLGMFFGFSLIREFSQFITDRIYFLDIWNFFDYMSILCFFVGNVFKDPAWEDPSSLVLDTQFWSLLYGFSLFFCWFRVLRVFYMSPMGIPVSIFFKMFHDLGKLAVIWLILIFAFSMLFVGVDKNLAEKNCKTEDWYKESNGSFTEHESENWFSCQKSGYWFSRTVFLSFGEFFLEDMHSHFAIVVAAFAFLFVNIMLINLLVATMTSTYEATKQTASMHRLKHRYDLAQECAMRAIAIPPILNSIFLLYDYVMFRLHFEAIKDLYPECQGFKLFALFLSRNHREYRTRTSPDGGGTPQLEVDVYQAEAREHLAFMERARALVLEESKQRSHSANVEHISQHLSSQDSVPSLRTGERVSLEAVAEKLELEKQELEKELTKVKAALESKTKSAEVRSASARIRELDALLEQRLVNQREYDGQKAAIIASV